MNIEKKIKTIDWTPSKLAEVQRQVMRKKTKTKIKALEVFTTPSVYWNTIMLLAGSFLVLLTHSNLGEKIKEDNDKRLKNFHFDWCESGLVCASGFIQICLGIVARFTAGCIYVALSYTFSSMAHAATNAVSKQPLIFVSESGLFGTPNTRQAHFRGGRAVLALSFVHATSHLVRWILRKDIMYIRQPMVIAGFISFLFFCLLSPSTARKQMVENFVSSIFRKQTEGKFRISYELWMRCAHHSATCCALVAGALHHCRFALVIAILISLWLIDYLIQNMRSVWFIASPHFVAVGENSGTLITFENPAKFEYTVGDYIKIRLPWLPGSHGNEWHSFTIVPFSEAKKSMIFCASLGDWTSDLEKTVRKLGNGIGRPMLLSGPSPAPFNTSVLHNYIFIIATGIGITPCLAALERYGTTRDIDLIWILRDANLLRLYANYLDNSLCRSAIVYYTGPCQDNFAEMFKDLRIDVRKGRPEIKDLVTNKLSSSSQPDCTTREEESKVPVHDDENIDLENGRASSSDAQPILKTSDLGPLPAAGFWAKHMHGSKINLFPPESYHHPSPLPQLTLKERTSSRCLTEAPIEAKEFKVFYCGSSQTINKTIEATCKKLGASFASESFWF